MKTDNYVFCQCRNWSCRLQYLLGFFFTHFTTYLLDFFFTHFSTCLLFAFIFIFCFHTNHLGSSRCNPCCTGCKQAHYIMFSWSTSVLGFSLGAIFGFVILCSSCLHCLQLYTSLWSPIYFQNATISFSHLMQILLYKNSMTSQGFEVGDSTSFPTLKPRIYCHRYWILEKHSTRPKMWKAHKVSKNWRKKKNSWIILQYPIKN